MNSVVVIGGAPLRQIVDAYRVLVPTAVWMLGLKAPRDPNDEDVRSLESLVEPMMQQYFAAEAQVQAATLSTQLKTLLLPARNADPNREVNAVSATLLKDVAATLALIGMLDRAHAIQPVELVLNDDSSALARTAVAWAHARGLPSLTLPARVPLRRPRKPCADRTITVGDRSRRAYGALDVADSSLINLSPKASPYDAGAGDRSARRIAAKAALTRALGWPETDIVVVFEPGDGRRQSALEPASATRESLSAVFGALLFARMSLPTLRLALIGAPSQDGRNIAAQAAANAGLTDGDFAYGDANYDVWIAAADISVSVDSTRSMDAAGAGVPSINLWRSANWYLGPAFAAEDGVIDVPPHLLGTTLLALANDQGLRNQISAIAGARMSCELQSTPELTALIAAELVKHRRVPLRRRLPYGDPGERAAAKVAGKAALTRALGWPESDIIVAFEPADALWQSTLDPADAFRAPLAAVFTALVQARVSVPTMRLAVIGGPSPEGYTIAARAAASAGLSAADFAYAGDDYDVWIAAADVVVSVDSMRSLDVVLTGVPAINLWRPANWKLTPLCTSEDGVIDIPPQLLGATLVALVNDKIVSPHASTIRGDQDTFQASTPRQLPAFGGAELARYRHGPIAILPETKPDIVICAPAYQHASAGLRALYRLCHFINLIGGNASIFPGTHLHPSWNTPRRDTQLTDRTIVVYPEIYAQSLPAKRVVRWVLNIPGLLGGPKSYGDDEMVFYYHQAYRAAAQAATTEVLTDERELQVAIIEPEVFYNDRSRPRTYDCVFVYKGQALFDRVQHREIRDAYVIHSGWPASRMQTAELLRGCRRLYSFDGASAIVTEGIICGAEVFMMRDDGVACYTGTEGFNVEDYERRYYDLSPVRRFLRLVNERWGSL